MEDKFHPGTHAATFVRTGNYSFAVFPRGFAGSHVLELVDINPKTNEDIFVAYLDGVEFSTSGSTGLWDLLEMSVGQSRFIDDEDV